MEPKDYVVTKIEGEYAYIKDTEGNEIFIALYLLPEGTDVGSKLHWENFTYTLIEQKDLRGSFFITNNYICCAYIHYAIMGKCQTGNNFKEEKRR